MNSSLLHILLSLSPNWLSSRLAGDFVPIFMLHRILDSQAKPDKHRINMLHNYLKYLHKNKYQAISLQHLCESFNTNNTLPKKAVVFTLDDGFADQVEVLAPIFSQYEVPLTCFVITDMLDEKLWPWDEQVEYIIKNTPKESFSFRLPNGSDFSCNFSEQHSCALVNMLRDELKNQSQSLLYPWLDTFYIAAEVEVPSMPPEAYRLADLTQLNGFIKSGHHVAAHTKTHRILSQLDDKESEEEILGSYFALKQKIPNSSDVFAYPTGRISDFGERERQIIVNSPMIGAVSTVADSVRAGYMSDSLPRFALPWNFSDFLQYLSFVEVIKNKLRGLGT